MPLPSWTRELFTGSLDEVAKRLQNAETLKELQSKATHLFGDLPISAARGIDRLMQETRKGTDHLRRWVRRQTTLNVAAINGTGTFFHPLVEGSPLHADAAEMLVRADEYFSLKGGLAEKRIDHRLSATSEKFGSASQLVAHSMSLASLAVGASIQSTAAIVIPRACSTRFAGTAPLADLISATGQRVIEIGTPDHCSAIDWDSALRHCGEGSLAVTILQPPCNSGIAISPPPQMLKSVQMVPYGCFEAIPGLPNDCCNLLSSDLLKSHWLTIVPCHLLLGGPTGALILGTVAATQTVSSTPVWHSAAADLLTRAALTTAIEAQQEQAASSEDRPRSSLRTLLAVSQENLQNRAERLATQLAGESAFKSCRITQDAARFAPELPANVSSRQVRIAASGNPIRLKERLESEAPALILEAVNEELVLDLRWIPSHLDASLAGLLTEQTKVSDSKSDGNHEMSS